MCSRQRRRLLGGGDQPRRLSDEFQCGADSQCFLVLRAGPAGLVSWWRGEGDASDSAGTNNGVLEGGVAFAAGEVGQAFSFNGTNADVRVPASASLNVGLADGFTIETWINPADITQGRPLVEWNDGSFGVNFSIAVAVGAGPGSLFINVKDTSCNDHFFSTAAGLLVSNVWQHVAATYVRSNGSTVLYINGVAEGPGDPGRVYPADHWGFVYWGEALTTEAPDTLRGFDGRGQPLQPRPDRGGDRRPSTMPAARASAGLGLRF